MRGEGSVAGERKVVGVYQSFILGVSVYHAIDEYQLRLDVQRFPWPVYYLFTRVLYFTSWGIIIVQ